MSRTSLAPTLALAALVAAGAAAGAAALPGFVFASAADPVAAAAARDQILLSALAGHLERSERLLVEVANAEPEEPERPADLAAERRWAEDLLAANRLYRQSARQGGRPRLAAVLDELEPLLLELTHAPDELSAPELATLRERIEERALVFKMRVVGDRLQRLQRLQRLERLERLERRRRTAAADQTTPSIL